MSDAQPPLVQRFQDMVNREKIERENAAGFATAVRKEEARHFGRGALRPATSESHENESRDDRASFDRQDTRPPGLRAPPTPPDSLVSSSDQGIEPHQHEACDDPKISALLSQHRASLARVESEKEALRCEIDDLRAEIKTLKERKDKAELEAASAYSAADAENSKRQVSELSRLLEAKMTLIRELEAKLDDKKDEAGDLKRAVSDLRQQLSREKERAVEARHHFESVLQSSKHQHHAEPEIDARKPMPKDERKYFPSTKPNSDRSGQGRLMLTRGSSGKRVVRGFVSLSKPIAEAGLLSRQ